MDSTGAGDTFIAGCIAALASDPSIQRALEVGCAVAGQKVAQDGFDGFDRLPEHAEPEKEAEEPAPAPAKRGRRSAPEPEPEVPPKKQAAKKEPAAKADGSAAIAPYAALV